MYGELSVKDEAQQEYEREVVHQACGAVEYELCDAIETVCRELKRIKRKIASHHNELRVNRRVTSKVAPMIAGIMQVICEGAEPDFSDIVAVEDGNDSILDHEMAIAEVRAHYRGLVERYSEDLCSE